MTSWPIQDAKARFSEMIEASLRSGAQIITKRGVETAVVVPIDEWRKLSEKSRKSAMDLLLRDPRRFDLDLPERKNLFAVRRAVDFD